MSGYHYVLSEPGLYTVGTGTPGVDWHADSDHETRDAAAARVAFLNGGASLLAAPAIGTTDQHVYHHTDPKPATVNVTVTRNTKGIGWEVTVNGAETPAEAVGLAKLTIDALRAEYGAEEVPS